MAERIKGYAGKAVFGLAAGVGFNLCQRLLDHVIDGLVTGNPALAWLS